MLRSEHGLRAIIREFHAATSRWAGGMDPDDMEPYKAACKRDRDALLALLAAAVEAGIVKPASKRKVK